VLVLCPSERARITKMGLPRVSSRAVVGGGRSRVFADLRNTLGAARSADAPRLGWIGSSPQGRAPPSMPVVRLHVSLVAALSKPPEL
jgi:hypothetical protein